MTVAVSTHNKVANWLKSQILLDLRVVRYGLVAGVGILINLGTMALLVTMSSHQSWMQSGVASVVSMVGNFFCHNLWTFSDRQHQGSRLIRGFLAFACMSAAGIGITTAAYLGFTQVTAHLALANSHAARLGIVLGCQLLAILLGGFVSFMLNREFTWAPAKEKAPAPGVQVQEG